MLQMTGDLVRDSKSGTEETIQVEKVISHPSYNRPTRFNNDIALLKLSKPAKLSQHVRTVCLPNQGEEVPVGSKCYISGISTDLVFLSYLLKVLRKWYAV